MIIDHEGHRLLSTWHINGGEGVRNRVGSRETTEYGTEDEEHTELMASHGDPSWWS
jgi:hypothetical protein